MAAGSSDVMANTPPVLQTLKALRYVQQMIATQEQMLMEQTTPNTRQMAYRELGHETSQADKPRGIAGRKRRISQPSDGEDVPSHNSGTGFMDTVAGHSQAVPHFPKAAWVSDCDVHVSGSSESDCSTSASTVRCLNDIPVVKPLPSTGRDKVASGRRSLLKTGEPLHMDDVELSSNDRSASAADHSHDLSHDSSHDQGAGSPDSFQRTSASMVSSEQEGGFTDDDSVVLLPATSEDLTATSNMSE